MSKKSQRIIEINAQDITKPKQVKDELRQAKERAEKYLDIANVMIAAVDANEKITMINKKGCEYLGYKEKELIGKNWLDLLVPKNIRKDVKGVFNKLMAGQIKPVEFCENPLLTKKGEERLFAFHNTVFRDSEGKIIGALCSAVDITECRKAEEALKKSEEKYRSLTETTSDWVWEVDHQGVYTYASPKVKDLLGYNSEEIIGKTPFDLMSPDEAKRVAAEYGAITNAKKPFNRLENVNLHKDGRRVVLETSGVPLLDANRNLLGYRGIDRDITKRKKAEEALRESGERYRSIISESPVGIAIYDASGQCTVANNSVGKIIGATKKQVLKQNYNNIKSWKKSGLLNKAKSAIKKNSTERHQIKVKSTFGKTVRLDCYLVPFSSGGLLLFVNDISERMLAEEEIKRTKEYLQNILNSASEAIITFDKNNRIITWNKTAEYITGYKRREVIRKTINKLEVFDQPEEVIDHIKSVYNGHKTGLDELILKTKEGDKKILKASTSTIRSSKDDFAGILFIGKDITFEIETYGKLIRGSSYLVSDKNNEVALNIFMNLTKSWHEGLYITRTNLKMIKNMFPPTNIKTVMLNQDKLGEFENISDLNGLTNTIKEFSSKNKNSVILLDRIDYLLTRFSFEQFVEALYQINNIISKNTSILLVYVNPAFLNYKQMAFIKAELQPLPGQIIEDVILEDELFNVLKFIYDENQNNTVVSFKKICTEFSIVKSTAAKKIRTLEDKDLVYIKKRGRLKTVNVSVKGKTLLSKKEAT